MRRAPKGLRIRGVPPDHRHEQIAERGQAERYPCRGDRDTLDRLVHAKPFLSALSSTPHRSECSAVQDPRWMLLPSLGVGISQPVDGIMHEV